MDSPWMARLAAQSSMDTIGGNCTTATEDEECGLPRSTSKMPPWRDPAGPRSPRTPQAQIVKNNFRATYRVSGRKASRSKLSFISPEIIRDGRHGLFTHFEEGKAVNVKPVPPPSASPKEGQHFVRSVPQQPSPAVARRRLRVFQDSSARRYYETPRRANEAKVALSSPPRGPAPDAMAALDTAVADLVDSSSPEKRVAGGSQCQDPRHHQPSCRARREVRGKLSFPEGKENGPPHRSASPAAEAREVVAGAPAHSPVSALDAPGCLSCELCGQSVDGPALARICDRAIPYLQSRGRYVSVEGLLPMGPSETLEDFGAGPGSEGEASPSAGSEDQVATEEEEQVDGQAAALCARSARRRRSRAQRRVWRSLGGPGNASLGSPAFSPASTLTHPPGSMIEQDLARKLEMHRQRYTPVKTLIYSGEGGGRRCVDVNAATFLFASQMKLTLNGSRGVR